MSVSTAPMEAAVEARVDAALGAGAHFLADKLFEILAVQYQAGPGGAYVYATPGAPPRRVTGNLQSHVHAAREAPCDWVAGVTEGVHYARALEYVMDHAFVSVVVEENYDELGAVIAAQLGGA